jgi:hypothetical protein
MIGIISILVLAGVLSGVSYANPILTQITFGPSTSGSVTSGTSGVKFSGVSGWAYQGASVGSFTLANASIAITSGSNGIYTLAPNSEAFTVTIGTNHLDGTSPATPFPTFIGAITVGPLTTSGFRTTGFPVGGVVDTDFIGYKGGVSAGEIVPDPVPEPSTITMVGSGLLAMAGTLRRRF